MEAEVGSTELILSTKREEHGALIGEKLENTVKEMIPGELKNVEAGQNQPPETFQNTVRSEEMQKGTDSEAETVKIVNGDRVEASRGECFLESPPVATAASEETCKASANHQSDETTILAEENMVETESQQQNVAKTVAAVEGGKVETDNVDRDPQNSETVINNPDIKNVTEENKYVEKFAVMASEETISQEINNAEVDIHRELSKNDELLDLQRFLEKSETQKDKFEGYLDVISENAAAPTGGHEEDMKEDPTTDNTYAEKSSNFPEYMVDSQEEIEAGKVDHHGNSSELCPLHEEAAAEVKREKQNEVCEASGSTTAEEKPNEGTYEVQKGVESSLNHVPEYGLPRDEVDKKQNETEFEMLEKVSKMETEDRMVVKDPAENIDEAKTEEALNTGLQEITTKGHDSEDRFLEGSHAGEAELNCKDNSCKSENLIELNTVLNGEIYDKPIVMEAEGETKEHVKEAGYVEDVATGSTKIDKVKSTENEVEACNFKEEPFEEPEAAGMDKLTTIETIQDDRTLESTAVDTSLKHEDSLPPEVETLAPAEASKEENDQSREQDIQHDEEEKEVLQEHQLGDKIERSIDVAYKDERTAPTEDVGEKISVTEEGDDVADRSNVNKENGSLEEDSKLPTEASEESNVTDTINMESTSKTDETEVEKVDGEYKLHEETKSKNVEDITEAETAKESSEANLLAETRCNDTERTDDEVPSNIRELDRVDELTEHRPEENEAIKETKLSEDSTYKVASGEDYAEEQTVNVAASDLSPQSINEETVGIFHDNKNNAKEFNVQVDDKLEPPSISEHVEEHILEEPDIKEIFTVQTEKKTVEEIYREHEMVAEANMPQQEVHAIPQTSEQEEEVEKHIEEKPTTLEENVTSVEEQTIPDSPEKEDKKPEIHEKDETARNITKENAITNIPSPPVAEETTKESLIEDETDKEVLHQEVKDLSVESIEQNLEPSETKSNTSKDTAEPNAAKEETTLTGIDENLVDKTLVSEVPREEKGEIFEPEPTVTDSNSASVDITTEETSMKECSKMMVDPVELEAEAEDLASIAASGVKVDNEHADEQTENMIEEKETVIPTAGEHGIDEPAEKIEQQADEADQRDLVTGAKPLEGSVEGDTEEASAPEAKEHKLGTIEASEAIDGTPAEDETPLAHEEVEVDEDTLEIKEREMLETEKPSELQGTCENSDAEISKNQEALDIEIAENAEISRSLIEGSKGIEELGTSTNNKEADLKQEEPAGNFEESTKVIESNKAELDHNHDFESVNPGEKCQNACEPVSEKQWDNKQPETSETKLKEEKEHDAITEETMAQSTQECIKQECEEVEPKCEAEDHNNQTDDSIEITKTSKITEEGNNFECEEDSNTKAEESQLMRISDDQIAQKDDDSIVVVDALSSDAAELENTGNASTEEAKICAEKLETAPANEVLKELSSQEKDLEDEPTDNCSDAKVLHSITTETDLHNEESKTMKPEEISESVAVHSTTECENTVQKEELWELEVLKLGFEPTEEEKGTPEELSKGEDKPQEISSKPETEESVSQTVNADSLSEEPDTEPTRPTEYSLQETSKSEDILEVVNKYEEASDPDVQKNEEVIASEPPLQHEETLGTSEETEIKEENFQAATQPAAEKHLAKKHEEASSFELEKTKSTSRSMLGGQNDEALSSLEEAGDKEEHMAASDLIDEEHLKEEGREQSKEGFSLELQKTGKDLNPVPEVEEKDSLARPEEDETQAKSFDTAKPESIIEENLQAEIREKDEETSTLEFETTARDFESTAEVQSHEALSKSEVTSKQEQPDAAVTELPVEENPPQEQDKKPKEETTLQSTKTEIDAAEVQSLEAISKAETTSKEEQQEAVVTELPVEQNPPQDQDQSLEETTSQSTKTEIDAAEFQSHEALSESETTSKEEQEDPDVTKLPVKENPPQGQGDNPKEETTLQSEKEIDAAEIQSLEALSKSETTSKEEQLDAGETELLVEENSLQEQCKKPKEESTLPPEKTEVDAAEAQSHEALSESETTSKEEQLEAGVTELSIEENPPQEQDVKPKEETTLQSTKTEIDAAEVQSHEAFSKSETTSKEEQLDAGVTELLVEENPPQEQGDKPEEETTLQLENTEIDAAEIQSLKALSRSETTSKEEQLDAGVTELLVEENSLQEQGEKPKEETILQPEKTEVDAAEAQSHEAPSESETTSKEEQLDAGVTELLVEENSLQEQGEKPKEETTLQPEKTEVDAAEAQSHEAHSESETTSKEEQLDAGVSKLPIEENPPQEQDDKPKEETTLQPAKIKMDAAEVQSHEALSKSETTSKEEQLDAGVTELPIEENPPQEQGDKPKEETTFQLEKTEIDAAEVQSIEALSKSETTSNEEQLDAAVTELPVEEKSLQEQDEKPKEETTLPLEKTKMGTAEAQSDEVLSQSETTSKQEQLDAAVTELPDEENSLQEQGQKPKEETSLLPEKTEIDAAEARSHEALTESEATSNEEQPVEENSPREQGEKPKEETTLPSEETKIAFEPEASVQENAVLAETEENETEAEILRAAEIQLPVEKKLLELVEKVENDGAEIKKEEAPAAEAHSFEATTVAEEILSKPITELKVDDTFHKQHGGNSKEASNVELEKTTKSFELIPEVGSPEELTESETRGKKEQLNAATTQLPVEGNLPEEQGEKIEKESSMELGKTDQGLESETQVQKNEILEKTEENETNTETLTAAATELPVEKKILELVENIKEESSIEIKKEKAPESAAKADSYEAFSVEAETLTNEEILRAPIAKQTAEETFYEQEGGNSIEASNEELDKKENSFESMQSMPEVASPEEHTESKTEGKKGQLNAATTQLPVVENVLEEQSKKLEEEPRTELEGTEQAFESEAQVQKKEKLSETEENETEAEIPGVEKIELPVERKILELVEKETELPVAHSCDTPKLAEESETNEETLTARTAEPTIEQNIHKSKETSNAEPEMTENAFESVPEVGSLREVSESETGGKVDKLTAATAQLQIKEYLPEEQGENLEEKSRMDLEEKPEQGIEVQKNENEILLETEENETKEEILGAAETELPVGKKLLELVEKVEEETSTYTKKETAAEYASEVKSPEAPTTADEIKEVHSPEAEEITTTKELLNAPNAEETIEENFPDGQGMNLDEATTNDLELEKTKKALESLPEVQSDQIPTELEGTEIKDEHLEVAAAELKAEENRCEKKIIVTEEIKREISSEKGMSETAASQDYHLASPGEEIKETLHEDGSNAKGKFSETFIIAKGTQNEALPQDLEAGKSEQRQGSVSCEDPVPDSDVPETVEEGAFIEAQHEHKVDDEEANKTDCNTQTKVTESEDMQSTRAGNKEDKIVDSVAPEKQLDQNIETHEESYDPSSPDTDSAGNLMDDEKLKYHKDATAERINQEYQEARYANPTTSCFVEPAQVETGKEEHIKAAAAELKIKEDEKAFELVHEVQSNEASSKSEESEAKLKILEDVTPESANKENLWDEVAEKHEEDSNAVFENTEASESILVVEPHEGVTDSEETKTREEHLQEAPAKLAIENLTEKQGQKHEEASPLELEKNEKALDSVSPDQKNLLVSKSEEGEAKKELVGATRESVVQENFPDVDRKQDETSNLEPEKTEKAPEPLPEEKDMQELIVARESQQASLDQDVAESCQEDELLREDEANKTLEATTGLTTESVHHEMTFTANEEVKQEILNEKVEHERVGDKDSQQAITIEDIKESLQADESLREDETKEDDPLGEDEATEKNHEAVTTDLAAEENLYEKTLTANDEVKNEISTELAVDNMAEKQCQTREEASNLELETSEKALDPVPADQKTEMVTRSEEDGTKKELIEAASKFSIQENFLDKDGMQDEAPKLEPEKTEKAPESGPEIQSHEPFCRSEEAEKGKMHLETETTELTGENFPGEQNEMSKEASKTELEITTRSLDFLPESQISDILTKSEDYEANEKDLDTATTDITAAKNEFERKIVGKKELKNEISTEEELVVAEESQQAFLDEIVKENCQEDGSLRQNEAKATITTKVSVGEEIKDSYQEAVEKNLEAVSTDLTAEENRCDKTSTATEEPKNKISNEEVLQEKVDVEDSHQVSTGEDIKDSPQEDEPSPANYPGDKINIASIITETETQVEQLAQHCEDGASQKAQRPGSNETLHIVSNRNDTDEESILQEAALEMKLNEMATEVDVEGQNGKPSTAETDTGPSIPSKEKKVPELVVLKHEWEPKESIDSEEIKKSKNEEEVNKMLSSPPTTCVTSEEPLPVKEGGKGEDASESLVSEMPPGESIMTCKKSTDVTSLYSEMPPGESHKNDDRLEQFEANSARNNSNVQSDQKEQMLCTRELESSWLTETIQKGEPSKGDEISKTEKENLFLEEHIDAKVVPSEEEESIKNGEEPNKSKVQAGAFTRATERKPDEDEIYSTLQDKKEEFGLLPHTLDSCADTSQKEGAVNLGEAYEIINNIQPPTKPSKAIPEEKISISIASDKNLETMVTTGNRDFPLVQEEPIAETARAYPPELQQGTCDEIKTGDENEETAKASIPEPSAHTSLFDLMERSIREHPHGTRELTDEKGQIVHEEEMYRNEAEKIHVEEPLTDEERECEEDEEEHKKADSGSDAPVMVEAHRDMDEKATHKKHHNILSGVGSKVKHSIAKVKKAITGKSSHHKQLSPK